MSFRAVAAAFFITALCLCTAHAEQVAVPFPAESSDTMNQLALEQMRFVNSTVQNVGGETCRSTDSIAEQGCRMIRDETHRFSVPFASTKGFWQAVKKAGGMEKFREKFGLYPASPEQKRGRNADLPMGLTFSPDRKQIHINCFACHGSQLNGISVEGGANGKLRLSELDSALGGKPHSSKLFQLAVGDVGFKGYAGASAATDMSLFTSSVRDPKTADVAAWPALKSVTKGVVGAKPSRVPVFTSPWWNHSPGLRNSSFYATGVANQGVGHIMQFAMGSHLTGDELRKLKEDFEKIMMCVRSTRPPHSPLATDAEKVAEGREIFNGNRSPDQNCNCAKCHGTTERGNYQYNEKIILNSFLKTDNAQIERLKDEKEMARHVRLLKAIDPNATESGMVSDYKLMGYIPTPLVAMFTKNGLLHNRSVPTARDLLCKPASERPTRWSWNGDADIFSDEAVNRSPAKNADSAYDTKGYGFSNGGHDFCGMLKDDPKACDAMLEYLKTL